MRCDSAIDGKLLVSTISTTFQQAGFTFSTIPKPVRTRQSEWHAAPLSAAGTPTRRPPSDTHQSQRLQASSQRRQASSLRRVQASSQRHQASSQRRQASSKRRVRASSQRRQASSQWRPQQPAAPTFSWGRSLQAPEFGWGPRAIRYRAPGTSLAAHLRQRHRLCNAASGVQGAALCECAVLARRVLSAVAVSSGEISANVQSAIVFFQWANGRLSNSMRPYRVVGPCVCKSLWTARMRETNKTT